MASAVAPWPSAHHTGHASFLVVKGYHMGSKWFADAVNHVSGAAFYFEYEHCLRKLAPTKGVLSEPETTLHYLRHSCGCADSCTGCSVAHPHHNGSAGSSATAAEQQQASGAHRARLSRPLAAAKAPLGSKHCLATGASFGALGAAYMAHLSAVLAAEPKVAVVVHVRSNHVKHALSFLRTTCPMQPNHLSAAEAARAKPSARIRMPPTLYLAKVVTVARAQEKVVGQAASISGRRGVAYRLVYEAMQLDLAGELRKLLTAVGVPSAAASAAVETTGEAQLVKAGSEDVDEALANFGEVEAYFRPLPCLRSMLVAKGPMVFEPAACAAELASFSEGYSADVMAARQQEGRMELNASECAG